jgi:hypothetical protein
MSQPEDEVKRALRIAKRALEAADDAVLLEDAHGHVRDAVHQVVFVLERLTNKPSEA